MLRFDEGLSADGGVVSGNFINAAVATPLGVTILLSSDTQPGTEVMATASEIAKSIRLVRQ